MEHGGAMKSKVTIKDVAKEAGVSISTVSRVLNDPSSVKAEKRAIVREAIENMGFQPSSVARGMVARKSHEICVLLPDIDNPYFTILVLQIDVASRRAGYTMILFNTLAAGSQRLDDPVEEEELIFSTIKGRGADGVIVLGGEIDRSHPSDRYVAAFNGLADAVPVVVVGQEKQGVNAYFLPRALRQGAQIAVQHLLAMGKTRIGFIGGEPGVTITEERLDSFKATMGMYHHELREDWIVLGDYYAASGYDCMARLLEREERPEAVLAINDKVALGAIRALCDRGLACPADMAIVSCDAFPDGDYCIPRLTSVNQNNQLLGADAVKALVSLIEDHPVESVSAHNPELIIRESCGIELGEAKAHGA